MVMKRHKYRPEDLCAVKLSIVASKLKLIDFCSGNVTGNALFVGTKPLKMPQRQALALLFFECLTSLHFLRIWSVFDIWYIVLVKRAMRYGCPYLFLL